MFLKVKRRHRYVLVLAAVFFISSQCLLANDGKQIRPADTLPKTTPWDLKALSKPPEFKWSEGKKVQSLYYKSEPYKGKPTRVFAYYATPGSLAEDPAKDKDLPAVVLVHGGGGKAFDQWAKLWAKRGYAAIAMDLAGCGPNKKRLTDGGPGQGDNIKFGTMGQPVTDQWTYHAVANAVLAHSLIRSFPEVDVERTAVTGISWGGYLTCIVAGLDNRFKAAVPVYGCGFLHENSFGLNQFKKMSAEHKAKWVRLWDPSMYVGSASMPMLFVNGGKDFAYPPDSHAKTYALVKSDKNIRFSPALRHGHIFDRPKAIEVYIGHYLKGGVPLARIATPDTGKKHVTASVNTKTKLVSAQLYYTSDKLPGNNRTRKWVKMPATIEQNRITAGPLPKDAVVWFLTVTDERNTMVSSKLMFPDG